MANLNIAIQIAAQDQASGPLGHIRGALSSLGNVGGAVSQGFGGLQTVIGGALVGAAGLGAAALVGVGVAAFNLANDVQTATANIQAELGTTAEEAERLGAVAVDVWENNFAGSIPEAANALGLVRQQLGDLADNELQRAIENAFRLNDVFGVETSESINAAATLMEKFGLTSEEAFDFIASGFQRGLDRSGDFLDTIGEYSTQFANGGADAGQFFSLLESGLQGGMLGTDKAADAFKEFRVRIQDGSTLTAESLEMIGINSEELFEGMRDGTVTAADAFQLVTDALGDVDDQNLLMQAGVGLLGTQFEDLGTEGALALSLIGTEMADLEGATGSLDAKYNNLGSVVEGFKRRGLSALLPIGNVLLNIANSALPLVENGFAFFETSVVPAIEDASNFISGFFAELQNGNDVLSAAVEALLNWTDFGENMPQEMFDFVINLEQGLRDLWAQVQPGIAFVTDLITQFVSWQDVIMAVGLVVASIVLPALGSIVAAAAPVIAVGALLIAGIALVRNAWENDWGGIQEKVQTAVTFIQGIITTVMTGIQTFWAENGAQILATAQQVWSFIAAAVELYINFYWTIITTVAGALATFWEAHGAQILAGAQAAWTAISTAVDTAINFISTTVTTVATALQTFWDAHGELILATAQRIWTTIQEYISGVWDTITALFAAFKSAFEGDWEGFGENLRIAWDTAWQTIVTYLGNLWSIVQPILSELVQSVIDFITGTDWLAVGNAIVQGIANGISAGAGAIADAATSAAQAAFEAAKAFLGIESPSRLAADLIGLPFSQGVARGISANSNLVDAAISDLFGGVGSLSAGAAVGSGPVRIDITIDARGATNPRAVDDAGYRGTQRALREAGVKADIHRRSR